MDLITTTDEFENVLEEYVWVFVDFYAVWCGPCKRITPTLLKLKKEFTDVYFCKIDVDKAEELTQKYKIRQMPTFLLLKNGKVFDEISGADPDAILKLLIKTKKLN